MSTLSAGPGRVLVVAAHSGVASALWEALADHGFEPHLVADGEAALRVIDGGVPHVGCRVPDAVVLDLRMPALDGWLLLTQLGGRVERPRIVASSSPAKVEEQQRAFDLGADAVVPGPFDASHVARAVAEVLARSSAPVPEAM